MIIVKPGKCSGHVHKTCDESEKCKKKIRKPETFDVSWEDNIKYIIYKMRVRV